MDSKSLVLTEQFSFSLFSKRKLVSGFVLGLAVSLFIFSLIFLTSPGKSSGTTLFPNQSWFNSTSSVHSSLVSWFFPLPSVEISSNSSSELQRHEEKGVLENNHILNFSQSDQNKSFSSNSSSELQKHEEKTVLENTHTVNFSQSDQNKSFSSNSSSELQKREEKTVLENTHVVNFSQSDQNKSFSSNSSSELQKHEEKTVLENTQVVNFFQGDQHASFSGKCDIFAGKWVRDERKPYYPAGSCPYIDLPFDCNTNGRPDHEFEKWRWQPNDCEIPRFNGTDFLERLRGKRLTFVGDSINRNAWQSLVCLLRHDIKNKKRVYEISGRKEFKTLGIYSFRYKDYNCSVEFVRTPFLVREMFIKAGNGSEDETLRLDLMDKTTSKYKDANIIIFNTGHWWTHEKPSRGKDYYQEGKYVYPMLNVKEAYKKGLTTWAKWVDKNIDAKKTHIIFRGYSVTHFRGRQWNSGGQCHKETEPIFNESYLAKYPSKMTTLESVIKKMATPVIYLNISKLTDYRKDAHPSIYRMAYQTVEELVAAEKTPDCSHWCLPGVPDMWNELLYAALLMKGWGSEKA